MEETTGCYGGEVEHPMIELTDNSVINMYSNYIKPTFEQIERPDRSKCYKFCGHLAPEGYKITLEGVRRRYASETRMGWKYISSTPAILSAISENTECGIHEEVQITYTDGPGRNVYQVWVSTAKAFSPGIAAFLRKRGAVCTNNDGRRLADYFRDCYMLRMQEAMEVHESEHL